MNTKPLPENSSMMANTDAAGYPIFRPKRKRPKLAEQQETTAEYSPLPYWWKQGLHGFNEQEFNYIVKACNEYEKVVAQRDQQERFKWEANKRADRAEEQRDELLTACKRLAAWVGKGIADNAYRECVLPYAANIDLKMAEAAIANASKPADSFTNEKLHEMGCSYDREQIDGGE